MPRGQASTTWFPELKKILKDQWNSGSDVKDHFKLIGILNNELNKVRKDLNVKPQTFFCRNCNDWHQSEFSKVTITSMYFALERFEICDHQEHFFLKRQWRKYSKEMGVNINGESINTEENKETRKHNRVDGLTSDS